MASAGKGRNNKNQDMKGAMPTSKKALPIEENKKIDELPKREDDHEVLTKRKVAEDADDLKPRNLQKLLDGEVRIPQHINTYHFSD